MRRSMIWSCLLTLEPVEFGRMSSAPREFRDSRVTTEAMAAIDERELDQYVACRVWLAGIKERFGPDDGWLNRYADALLRRDEITS